MKKDCHPAPLWCARKTCRSKKEYYVHIQAKRGTRAAGGTPTETSAGAPVTNPAGTSKDFKIAMCTMLAPEDRDALAQQFGVDLNAQAGNLKTAYPLN